MRKWSAVFVFILSLFLTAPVSAQEEEINKEEAAPAESTAQVEAPAPVEPDIAETIEPEVPAPVASEAMPSENVLVDDALPKGATAEGNWVWDDALKSSGEKSHTEPAGAGLYGHSFKLASPLAIKQGTKVVQYVYLDPQSPAKGIVLKFNLKTDEEVGVYWEGADEAVTNLMGDEELLWYQDELPKTGEWVKLEIPASEAEIEDEEVVGISYMAVDGKVNWDKTAIVEGTLDAAEGKEE